MTEDTTAQPPAPVKEGKIPVGFWWILTGIILLICGIAIVVSVLPRILDGSVMAGTSSRHRSPEIYITGPLLPGVFALAFGLDLRRKAGLLKIPGIIPGIADSKEKE